MKVLFIAVSTRGYGETLIGLSLAKRLRTVGVEPYFLVERRAEPLLAHSGLPFAVLDLQMGPFAELVVDDVITSVRPDLVILSDYFTYYRVLSNLFHIDPWLIDSYDIPVVPIDIWEWEHTSFQIDVFGGSYMESSRRILDMPAYLQPVPLCHVIPTSAKAHPFSISAGEDDVSVRTRKHLRTVLGLEENDKLVVLSLAPWQIMDHDDADCNRIARCVPELLFHYLGALPDHVHIANVGERFACLERLPSSRVHYIPPCSPDRFNVLLGSADLFITLNIGATTLTKAVLRGIQGLVLVNSYAFRTSDDVQRFVTSRAVAPDIHTTEWLHQNLPLYPFKMWPLGFDQFLRPLLANNPYTRTFATVELFDEAAVAEALTGLLFDEGIRRHMAEEQVEYRRLLSRLDDVCTVFGDVARASGLQVS